jgi:chromosome segregation ATPase
MEYQEALPNMITRLSWALFKNEGDQDTKDKYERLKAELSDLHDSVENAESEASSAQSKAEEAYNEAREASSYATDAYGAAAAAKEKIDELLSEFSD